MSPTLTAVPLARAFSACSSETDRTKYPTLDAARVNVFDECIKRFHDPRMRQRAARQELKFPLSTTTRGFGVKPLVRDHRAGTGKGHALAMDV